MAIKICRRCGIEFEYQWKSRNFICNPCNAIEAKEYREKKKKEREQQSVVDKWRICCRCKENKPLIEFPKNKCAPLGRGYACFLCNRADKKKQRDRDRVGHNIRKRLSFFKISQEEYDTLFERANNLCEICEASESAAGRPLGIDHCHSSGKIRGVLCNKCNWLIGAAQERTDILTKAITYLQERTHG